MAVASRPSWPGYRHYDGQPAIFPLRREMMRVRREREAPRRIATPRPVARRRQPDAAYRRRFFGTPAEPPAGLRNIVKPTSWRPGGLASSRRALMALDR